MLFQVDSSVADRTIRRSYFKLSKEFHPDLFFRKELGGFKERMEEIFRWISLAYDTLSDRNKRARYDADLRNAGLIVDHTPQPEDSQDYRGLGDKAREKGNFRRALHFYCAGMNARFEDELAISAALCLVELHEDLDEAERLCKRALSHQGGQQSVGALLALASVYGAEGRHKEAALLYQQVKQIEPENVEANERLAQTR
jgi:curved DNA-binding protein CbpA